MKALLLTTGYLPYTFSECLCNAKLVYALQENGWEVDVISRVNEGESYSTEWQEPWLCLQPNLYEVTYPMGSTFSRCSDSLYSILKMGFPLSGIRWARRAYQLALKLHKEKKYDVILTRSPSDVCHVIGLKLKKRLGIRWMANWNDPVDMIWPSEEPPYIRTSYKGLKRIIYNHYFNSCFKYADVNSFPAQTLLDHFKSYFPILSSSITSVIPHIGLTQTLFSQIPYEKRSKFRLIHAGNLVNKRNPELFFKALREIIDETNIPISFDIMGIMSEYMFQLVEKYKLHNVVNFIGSYSYIDALNLMGKYDVLVLIEARMRNGIFFASKITDYAQVGRPILAISPIKGFAKSIIDQYGGGCFVHNEDLCEIKKGIWELYMAWRDNNLLRRYNTKELCEQFDSNRVAKIYNSEI